MSFLLAPNGESNRRSILYFWNDQLSGVRMDEFKFFTLVQLPNSATERGQKGGLSGTISPTAGSMMFNLYTNPQEDESIGIRHIPLLNEINRYKEVLKKYPPKVQIKLN